VPDAWKTDARSRAFAQYVSAETKQLGRPASGLLIVACGAFNQSAVFHKTS
jgi:hypothetical protein